MRNQGQLILGVVVIVVGAVLLIGSLFDVDVWVLCWPIGLIVLGLLLLLRPQLISSDTASRQKLLGDIRRRGEWQVSDEEFWLGIGDVTLDMTSAEIPPGETHLRVVQFVGDIRLSLPEGVGVSLSSTAMIGSVRAFGRKRDIFFTPLRLSSENYETAERKVRLETSMFIGDVRIRQAEGAA
jgi:lia operon protein LiaF